MRIAFFGTPPPAVDYLEALHTTSHEIPAVVTQPDRPAGRGRKLRASAVKKAAQRLGLNVLTPEAASEPGFIHRLGECNLDLGVVVAYGQILDRALLAVPETGFVNVHYSLLPELRGAAPVYGALRKGLETTGVTIQWMAEELDAGDIIAQETLEIAENDNRETLTNRLTEVGVDLLLDTVELIAHGEAEARPQDASEATWVGRVETDDCRIDWSLPAEEIRRLVRACTPWPGAWCLLDGDRVKVQDVRVMQNILSSEEGSPGQLVETFDAAGPVVHAGRGAVEIVRLQPAGKRPMSGEDFLRGARLRPGDHFT